MLRAHEIDGTYTRAFAVSVEKMIDASLRMTPFVSRVHAKGQSFRISNLRIIYYILNNTLYIYTSYRKAYITYIYIFDRSFIYFVISFFGRRVASFLFYTFLQLFTRNARFRLDFSRPAVMMFAPRGQISPHILIYLLSIYIYIYTKRSEYYVFLVFCIRSDAQYMYKYNT